MPTTSSVGLVSCACWNHHVTLSFTKCGFILLTMVFFCLSAIAWPYLTSIIRKLMPPFLPFISQAGGSPPSNGVFNILLIIATIPGMLFFILLFQMIRQRNVKNVKLIRICTNISFIFSCVTCMGMIITASNPIGYTDVPNKFQWITTVLCEHGTGAMMILVGSVILQFFLTVIWWYLPDTSKREKYIRITFVIIYIILFCITVYPLLTFMIEEFGPNPFDFASMQNAIYKMPQVYSTSYIISAVCEWLICIINQFNFMMHYKDLQRMSLTLQLRHKSCQYETVEPGPSLSLKIIK